MVAIDFIEDYENIFQNAPNGFLIINEKGVIINVNDTLLKWLGFNRKDVLFDKSIYDLLSMGEKIYIDTHLLPLLQLQGHVNEINLTLKGKGSISFPAILNAKKNDNSDSKTTTYWLSILKFEQRKNYEFELLTAKKSAENLISRLKQVNLELERFAYSAAHDLRAPLNNTINLLDIIEDKGAFDKDKETKMFFSLIRRSTFSMKQMIQDLLAYSKLEENDEAFNFVSLASICQFVMAEFNSIIKQSNIEVKIDDLPTVWGDENLLRRLFQNLVENAIKYRNLDCPTIEIFSKEGVDKFTIYVRDNGLGFKMKDSELCFEFMKRLENSSNIEGTGIGLATCKRIVEIHDGTIGVNSEQGEGSTFFFSIPKKP
jgi:PAS domain S-box-containing protein